jgi:hypothetical protein
MEQALPLTPKQEQLASDAMSAMAELLGPKPEGLFMSRSIVQYPDGTECDITLVSAGDKHGCDLLLKFFETHTGPVPPTPWSSK